MNFFIAGLARSRTAWFANYFTTGDIFCWHEGMSGIRSKAEYYEKMSTGYRLIGNADCGLSMGGYIKGSPLVVIRRDVDEVIAALGAMGYADDMVREVVEDDNKVQSMMHGMHVRYDDINERLPEIHAHLVDTPFDEQRANQLLNMNVQVEEVVSDLEAMCVWRA